MEHGGGAVPRAVRNQGTLREDAEHLTNTSRPVAESEDVDKSHGRVETRRCQAYLPDEFLRTAHDWPGLRTVVKVTATRFTTSTGDASTEVRYYISSLDPGQPFNELIRSHLGVENSLHWVLDMTFCEDAQHKRAGHSAQNSALVREVRSQHPQDRQGKGQHRHQEAQGRLEHQLPHIDI